jgi:hypothetical protein
LDVEAAFHCKTCTVISAVLVGIVILEYGSWFAQYLAWPWWADHDVFATMAQAWDAGQKPYRDLYSNNFPGTIYLFWLVGKLCGWGNELAYNALDAFLLGGFGATVLMWGRCRLGSWLPGALTLFALAHYYFGLDFSLIAQRDWHAALFAALAMMILEAVPGPWGQRLSALCFAIGLTIRPQVVAFLPGLLWALNASGHGTSERDHGPEWRLNSWRVLSWLLLVVSLVGLLFLPIIDHGLIVDLFHGLAKVLPGSNYNEGKLSQLATIVLRILAHARVWGLVLAIALRWPTASGSTRISATRWLAMFGGSVLYMAITPQLHPYVENPLWITWAFVLGVFVMMLEERPLPSWRDRLTALVLLGMVLDVGYIPSACNPKRLACTVAALASGRPPTLAPWGYRHVYGDQVVLFPWAEYQATLAYLRRDLRPETRVGNALEGIALNGPAGRLPAFPAESVTWLFVVDSNDEDKFIASLRSMPDSVVVWAPGIRGKTSVPDRFPRLASEIRLLYEPAARFGDIEVWQRRIGSAGDQRRHAASS